MKKENTAGFTKAQGYRTSCLGKWHLGDEEHHCRTRRGFDEFWGLRECSRNYRYDLERNDKPKSDKTIEQNGTMVKFEGHLTERFKTGVNPTKLMKGTAKKK